MFSGSFWGIILILIGLTIIINTIFGISIPILRIILAGFLMYLGFMLITGKSFCESKKFFSKEKVIHSLDHDSSYTIAFAQGTIDLSNIHLTHPITLKIEVFFGEGILLLPSHLPITIHAHATCGSLKLPDGTVITQGKKYYSFGTNQHPILLTLDARSVFGNLIIKTV